MRALTLWEPWASLIALGVKRIETRPWRTAYEGTLLIHAGQRKMDPREWHPDLWKIMDKITATGWTPRYGEAVCTAQLMGCVPFTDEDRFEPLEEACGDFTPGRWGWLLRDVRGIRPGVKLTGERGLWTPPDIDLPFYV